MSPGSHFRLPVPPRCLLDLSLFIPVYICLFVAYIPQREQSIKVVLDLTKSDLAANVFHCICHVL